MINIQDYPKTAEKIKAFFYERLLESLKDPEVPKDFKNFIKKRGVPLEKIQKLVDTNPRLLFDFFDKQGLIIETKYENGFIFNFVNEIAKDRRIQETIVINNALEKLENNEIK